MRRIPRQVRWSGSCLLAATIALVTACSGSGREGDASSAGADDSGSPEDPFRALPVLTLQGDGARVGPEGGHIEFPDGFALDVPAGALAEPTTIRGHFAATPGPVSMGFVRVAPDIEFLPDGLVFAKEARLSVSLPLLADGTPIPIDDLHVYSLSKDETQPTDPDAIELSPSQGLYASIAHFSEVVFYRVGSGATVEDLLGTCDTQVLNGLSEQIRQVLVETDREFLQEVTGWLKPGPVAPKGRPVWLQESAAAALRDALIEGKKQNAPKLVYNAHWRSVADQYLLIQPRCANYATAKVAESNHLDGTAIDVQGVDAMKTECLKLAASTKMDASKVLAQLHAPWGPILSRHGFEWFGIGAKNICGDPPHFDYIGPPAPDEGRADNMLAFQTLWNRNRPCQPISDSEIALVKTGRLTQLEEKNLPQTFAALRASPAGGFPSIDAVSIPAEGAEDLGCGTKTDQTRTTCCPAPPGGKPTCVNLQVDSDHCGTCNVQCTAPDECSAGSCNACGAPTFQCASGTDSTTTTYRRNPATRECEAMRTTEPCPASPPPQCAAGGVATTTYSCDYATGKCAANVTTTPCAAEQPPVCDGDAVVDIAYACNPTSGDCEEIRKTTLCSGAPTCRDGSCECAEGETECGDTCCPTGHACLDDAAAECDPCAAGETACGMACCAPGAACTDPVAGLCESCLTSPLGTYSGCVGTCGCSPKMAAPQITLDQAINECDQATTATVSSGGVQAWGESARLSADGTRLSWADGSTWVRECNPAQ